MKDVLSKIQDGDYDNPVKELSLRGEMKRYREEEEKIRNRFEKDLEKEFQVEDNPKKGLLWDLAWDYGHSSGLSTIFCYYNELVELIR